MTRNSFSKWLHNLIEISTKTSPVPVRPILHVRDDYCPELIIMMWADDNNFLSNGFTLDQ